MFDPDYTGNNSISNVGTLLPSTWCHIPDDIVIFITYWYKFNGLLT